MENNQLVMLNCGASSNGDVLISNGNGLEKVHCENGLVGGGDENGKGNLAEEVLEGLEEYWEDINDRLMISRMVSDSVIRGTVTAVEQGAAEKIAAMEAEVVNLKKRLQSHELRAVEDEDVRLPLGWKAYEDGRFSCVVNACVKHEKMREDLRALRNLAREQFQKAKSGIECVRGTNSIKRIGSGSELGLGGILQEKQSERWMNADEMLEPLRTTVETVCTKVDDVLASSKMSLCDLEHDLDLSVKLENIVTQSVLKSIREELEENFLEQNAQFCGIQNVNWLVKFNDVSSIGTQLGAIMKSLSIPETGLVSHGSHEFDQKAFNNHVTPPASLYGGNGTLEDASSIHVAEIYDFQQLKHMSKEELVSYFNGIITKMKRDHESVLQRKTEEYFRLKRECLKERGSFMMHRKDEEFDVLRKKIPEIISKLEDFLLENERFPALTNNLESMGKLKDRIEILLFENSDLIDCLTVKNDELKRLEAQVSGAAAELLQHSVAEDNMLKLVENLKSEVEDSHIEASINEEVYKFTLREQIANTRCDSEESNMEFLMTREIYDIILREATIPAENAGSYEIEDSDIESLMMQGLNGLILTEAIKDAGQQLNHTYWEVLTEKESDLKLAVEEKEKLKQQILDLQTKMKQEEMLAMDLSLSLSKEREQLELASREISNLREHAVRQQTFVTESKMDLETLRSQQLEALEKIEVDKLEMHKLNQKLDQTKEVLKEANEERDNAFTLAKEMQYKFLASETRMNTLKNEIEIAASGLSKMFSDLECRVSGAITKNGLRLEDTNAHVKALAKMANVLRRKRLMDKQRLEQRSTDLQMAEAEVDLLGDEVNALLQLLEKIYIALDHYSPVLKHYPGIIEILELVRRELNGESTMLSWSTPGKGNH